MMALLLQNITKIYDNKQLALRGFNLEIEDGEMVVILGPPDCGKTTLLRMVSGLETITRGEIRVNDRAINLLAPQEREVATILPEFALYPHMTVYENLVYGLKIRKVAKAEIKKKLASVVQQFDLESLLSQRAEQLTSLQYQRVAMGRAVILEPKIFLFDEPFAKVENKLRLAMRLDLLRWHRQTSSTCLYATQDQHEAITLANRIVVLNHGSIEQIGTPLEVFEKPASTMVANFIGSPAMNLIEVQIGTEGSIKTSEGIEFFISITFIPSNVKGRKVIMGIRPEHMVIHNTGGIEVEVELIENLGAEQFIHCRCGKLSFVVKRTMRRSSVRPIKVGDYIHVGPQAMQTLHWFNASTGRRIPVT